MRDIRDETFFKLRKLDELGNRRLERSRHVVEARPHSRKVIAALNREAIIQVIFRNVVDSPRGAFEWCRHDPRDREGHEEEKQHENSAANHKNCVHPIERLLLLTDGVQHEKPVEARSGNIDRCSHEERRSGVSTFDVLDAAVHELVTRGVELALELFAHKRRERSVARHCVARGTPHRYHRKPFKNFRIPDGRPLHKRNDDVLALVHRRAHERLEVTHERAAQRLGLFKRPIASELVKGVGNRRGEERFDHEDRED